MQKPFTKILVDGGDPTETERIRDLLGFVDGQTTNPSLVARNPRIQSLLASGHKLSKTEEDEEYKKIVSAISPLVGDAGVSIEVFSNLSTAAEEMLKEARDKFTWINNAYIKFPCTTEGLRAANQAVSEGIRCNITLCFSQTQAAAVYAATLGSNDPVYVSPFVGRLDDSGLNGMDLIKNIKQMFASGDGHVHILTASIRTLDHLMDTFYLKSELATVPNKVLEQWAEKDFILPDSDYVYDSGALKEIPYEQLDLTKPWDSFEIKNDLTDAGIIKFVADYNATLNQE